MKIVFMGTPEFAVPPLQRLIDDGHQIAAVYCQPDKPQGRRQEFVEPPVKQLAFKSKIPIFQPDRLTETAVQTALRFHKPDVIVVAAYGKLLPREVLSIPPLGCLNVHGSLLPKYRGAAPIQRAIMAGETTTGISVMRMSEGLDTGDILLRRETAIGPEETAGELFGRLSLLGAEALAEALNNLEDLPPVPQDDALASWAAPLRKADGLLNFTRTTAALLNRLRGVTPWPGGYAMLGGKRLKIHRAAPAGAAGRPGELLDDRRLIVACGDGALELLEVQLEGARRMSGEELMRGQRLTKGSNLFITAS